MTPVFTTLLCVQTTVVSNGLRCFVLENIHGLITLFWRLFHVRTRLHTYVNMNSLIMLRYAQHVFKPMLTPTLGVIPSRPSIRSQ